MYCYKKLNLTFDSGIVQVNGFPNENVRDVLKTHALGSRIIIEVKNKSWEKPILPALSISDNFYFMSGFHVPKNILSACNIKTCIKAKSDCKIISGRLIETLMCSSYNYYEIHFNGLKIKNIETHPAFVELLELIDWYENGCADLYMPSDVYKLISESHPNILTKDDMNKIIIMLKSNDPEINATGQQLLYSYNLFKTPASANYILYNANKILRNNTLRFYEQANIIKPKTYCLTEIFSLCRSNEDLSCMEDIICNEIQQKLLLIIKPFHDKINIDLQLMFNHNPSPKLININQNVFHN